HFNFYWQHKDKICNFNSSFSCFLSPFSCFLLENDHIHNKISNAIKSRRSKKKEKEKGKLKESKLKKYNGFGDICGSHTRNSPASSWGFSSLRRSG
ncbi:Tyrosine-protein phosphatase non-receptor type 6, partial [Bienertia sinuspersici]